jgi:hypothetical protein
VQQGAQLGGLLRRPPSRVRNTITKIAVAAAFVAIPTAAVNIPAYATPGFASTPSVLSAPPPADPPTNAPAPPAPPPPQAPAGQTYNPNDYWYNGGADGGGGG